MSFQDSEEFLLNPFPWLEEMRKRNPVYHDGDTWNVFTYEDVKFVLNSHQLFSAGYSGYTQDKALKLRERPDSVILDLPTKYTLLTADPPLHDELRAITADAFTPSSLSSLEPFVRETVRTLLDSAEAKREVDVVKDVAEPLPILVILKMLGLPPEDVKRVKEWSDTVALNLGKESGAPISPSKFLELVTYVDRAIRERKGSPGEGLVNRLVNARINGKPLSRIELQGYVILLLIAGNETTTNLIGHAVNDLTRFRAWERLRREPSLVTWAVEEVLRFSPPVRRTFRLAKRDLELRGVRIREGEGIKVWIASANRDENVFPRPNDFLVDRKPNPHLSFGSGIHLCLGAPLARLETRVLLEEMLSRYSEVEIVERELKPVPNPILNGLKNLRVELRRAQ
jgi:cytochrome P450